MKITIALPVVLLILFNLAAVGFLKNFNQHFFMTDASSLTLFLTGLVISLIFTVGTSQTKFSSKLLLAFVEAERLHKIRKTV
ncbi:MULTISPECIES: hypothetical protein [Acinetobacter]|uniref:hypothetical protein n=1 Tax=Acinetobacter TaxID=469 RepID=UPI0007171EB9|nr:MULTISPECIES: hypothetical protein [Acinetobacter]HAP2754584.1 hypothetical protein [Escherichia coli]EHU2352579.1 hypothetical protein [Acinetobacter baumannii]EHU2373030.1 hypothetical protein [Acinetobacter baumannii]EHU2575533.1 hypothetical protein [Acinetobacter baumannii]KRR92680.1 hypothetical protein ASM30_16990 [Acinetobacter baumannii]